MLKHWYSWAVDILRNKVVAGMSLLIICLVKYRLKPCIHVWLYNKWWARRPNMDQIIPKDSFTHLFKELICCWLQLKKKKKLHQCFSNNGDIGTPSKCLDLFLQYNLAHYPSALLYKMQPYPFPISSIKSSSISCPFILWSIMNPCILSVPL